MVERICPQCQVGNLLSNRFCGQCGASLERAVELITPVPAAAAEPAPPAPLADTLPVPAELKQLGRTVALSLASLAAEAGVAWLRQRVDRIHTRAPQPLAPHTAPQPLVPHTAPQPLAPLDLADERLATNQKVATMVRQRVVQVWEQGTITRQVVERTVWRREG